MFGSGKKTAEVAKKEVKAVKEEPVEPAALKAKPVEIPDDLKTRIRGLDRSGPTNLYSTISKTRMTKKERNSHEHLTSFLNEDLLKNERVIVQKYDVKSHTRGLHENQAPFPVQPKIGPYVVSIYL